MEEQFVDREADEFSTQPDFKDLMRNGAWLKWVSFA
jgi:hypothetical protein